MENQLFNEFSSGVKQEELGSLNNGHNYGIGSNISDDSSPSTVLNNVPLSNNEIDSLNTNIQNELDVEKLSEEELADRRKAQNRAAQRAFRERKEKKLNELRDQLDRSETDKAKLLKELEQLKQQNIVISTENKLLLENTSSNKLAPSENQRISSHHAPGSNQQQHHSTNSSSFTFPQDSPKVGIYMSAHQLSDASIPYEFKRLTVTEVWEYLVEKNETLDFEINEIMNEVKGLEVCHEHGPAYPLSIVDRVLEKHLQH